jgi:hypothetical protein
MARRKTARSDARRLKAAPAAPGNRENGSPEGDLPVEGSPIWQIIAAAQAFIEQYYLNDFRRRRRKPPAHFTTTRGQPQLHLSWNLPFAVVFLREASIGFAQMATDSTLSEAERDKAKSASTILEGVFLAMVAVNSERYLRAGEIWAAGKHGIIPQHSRQAVERVDKKAVEDQKTGSNPAFSHALPSVGAALFSFPSKADARAHLLRTATKMQHRRTGNAEIIRQLLCQIHYQHPELAMNAGSEAAWSKTKTIELRDGNGRLPSGMTPESLVRKALRLAGMSEVDVRNYFRPKS